MEQMVGANGIDICTESYGDLSLPAVLVIMGNGAQGVLGPDEQTERLVARGRRVIRYDARDTGRSSCFDFSRQPYTLSDMADDAVGVLDAYDIGAAHLFGGSMGGMVAQEVAILHPARVRTLTSFMSTPAVLDANGVWSSGLPSIRPHVVEFLSTVDWSSDDPEARVQRLVDMFRVLSGSFAPFDEAWARAFWTRQLARTPDPDTSGNHSLAIAASRDRTELLRDVSIPTLVIHGTEDPIIPYEHGVATAEAIPGARLLTVEGLGHELPPAALPVVLDALIEHTGRA